jgi:phosphoribosylformylglycinamidine cyclo-ligase
LIGGETATMPDIYHGDDYDLVGFIVGTVQRDRLIKREDTSEGDVLIGLPSSGLHTNGYSLVRKVYGIEEDPSVLKRELPDDGRTLGDALLEPHRSYLPALKPHLGRIKGLGHITGGGIYKNIPRVIADGLAAEVDVASWTAPVLFRDIQAAGGIDGQEMFRVFNMGLGMVVIASPEDAGDLLSQLEGSWVAGRLVKQTGDKRVIAKGL